MLSIVYALHNFFSGDRLMSLFDSAQDPSLLKLAKTKQYYCSFSKAQKFPSYEVHVIIYMKHLEKKRLSPLQR